MLPKYTHASLAYQSGTSSLSLINIGEIELIFVKQKLKTYPALHILVNKI